MDHTDGTVVKDLLKLEISIVGARLLHFKLYDEVKNVAPDKSEGNPILRVKNVIVEAIDQFVSQKECSWLWVPNTLGESINTWELRVYKEYSEN